MSKSNAMDAIEAAFAAKDWPRDFQISCTRYAARNFCGYEGSSYCEAVSVLAERYNTLDEIAALPAKAATARA